MKEETSNHISGLMGGLAIGIAVFHTAPEVISKLRERNLEGFVKPSQVNMKITQDIDSERTKGSIFKYAGRNYLMKYDEKTNAVSLVPYKSETILVEGNK